MRVDEGRTDAKRAIACRQIGLAGAKRADVGERTVELLERQVCYACLSTEERLFGAQATMS